MQTTAVFSVLQSVLSQTEANSVSGATLLLLIVTGSACAIAFWAFKQIGQFKQAVVDSETKFEAKAEALRQANAVERKLQASIDEKTDKVQKLKKDLANLRKKNHTHQEETKKLREAHKTELKKLENAVQAKPAYNKAESKPAENAPAPKETAQAKPKEKQVREPRNESELVKQLRAEVALAKEKCDRAVNKLKAESSSYAKAKATAKDMRFRVEKYRRVDIMTKNQLELANDKLLTLGRQYYDTVSEIAALKGEVIPPKPKELREAEAAAAARAAAAERAAQEAESAETDSPALEVEEAAVSLNSIDTDNLPSVDEVESTEQNAPQELQAETELAHVPEAEAIEESSEPSMESSAENVIATTNDTHSVKASGLNP